MRLVAPSLSAQEHMTWVYVMNQLFLYNISHFQCNKWLAATERRSKPTPTWTASLGFRKTTRTLRARARHGRRGRPVSATWRLASAAQGRMVRLVTPTEQATATNNNANTHFYCKPVLTTLISILFQP